MKKYYKNNILFQEDWYNLISEFSNEDLGSTIRVLFGTILKGEDFDLSKLSPMVKMAVNFLLPKMEEAKDRYAEKCRHNRENAKARWGNNELQEDQITDIQKDTQSDANVCDGIQNNANVSESMQSDADSCDKIRIDAIACERIQSDATVCDGMRPQCESMPKDKDRDKDNNYIVSTSVDTPSKADASDVSDDSDFEELWAEYNRKGIKKTAKSRFKKLSKKDKIAVRDYLPYYLAFTVPQYRKNFEVFISKNQWGNILLDPNGKEIPFGKNDRGQPLYRVADVKKFKSWFNKKVQGTKIPQVEDVDAERFVNLNICYTLYPHEMTTALKVVLHDEYYINMANKGMLTFDYIFNPKNIAKICERGKADGIQ